MRNKIQLIFIGAALLCSNKLFAQQDPQFSQYMFNAPYWSVALTGVDGASSVMSLSRNQWLGYESSFEQGGGAPITEFVNFTTPLTLLNTPLSLGANLIYDKLGPMTDIQIQLGLAYHWQFPRGTLSAGVRPYINNRSVDFSSLDFLNPNEEDFGGGKQSQLAFDLDMGVAYSTEEYTIGLGVGHLLRPDYRFGLFQPSQAQSPENSVRRDIMLNLYGEYRYAISYKFTLSPSALIQTDIDSYTFNVGVVGSYTNKIWGGVSYKNAESVVFLMGYSFLKNNSLRFGYSFDYVIQDRDAKAQTSHELYIKYYLPSLTTGTKKIIRTPRFRY